MLEEAPILDREYRVDQHLGNLRVTQYFTFSRFRRKIRGQNLRFELERLEQHAVATNLINLLSVKRHTHDLFRSGRPNLDCRIGNNKTATPNVARVCFEITSTTQCSHELFTRQLLAGFEHTRSRVEPGPAGQITSGKSRIDDLGVKAVRTCDGISRNRASAQEQHGAESHKTTLQTDPSRIGQRFGLDNHPSVLPMSCDL